MKSKRRPLLALAALVAALTGCTGRPPAEEGPAVARTATRSDGRKVWFDFVDPAGDDRGPGRYEYPSSFEGRYGFLDVTRLEVSDAGSFVQFRIEFRRPISRARPDGSTEAKGYWLPLVDIYVDTDHKEGSGRTWTLPGRQVSLAPESGWEKAIVVTPGNSRNLEQILRNRSSELEVMAARYDILVPERVYPQAYDLKVMVPKDKLGGEPQAHWGYQVLAMAYAPRNLARNQLQQVNVQRFADEYRFGGGSDDFGDPNVLDVLAPSEEEQYRLLSNYVSTSFADNNRFAVIPAIYLSEPPAAGGPPGPPPPGASAGAPPGPPEGRLPPVPAPVAPDPPAAPAAASPAPPTGFAAPAVVAGPAAAPGTDAGEPPSSWTLVEPGSAADPAAAPARGSWSDRTSQGGGGDPGGTGRAGDGGFSFELDR